MTRRKRWSIYAGIVTGMVVAQVVFLSRIISPYPDIRQPPVEANRVVHPTGFSIVKRGRTRAIVDSVDDGTLSILPDGGRSRYTPRMYVRRFREPPDPARLERDGFRAGTFQGQQALVYRGRSGEYDHYRVMTNRGGQWYEVALSIPAGESAPASIPSPEWERYLETFTATPTTTRPSGGAE